MPQSIAPGHIRLGQPSSLCVLLTASVVQLRWTPELDNACTYILQKNTWGLLSKISPSRQRAQFLLVQTCQWGKCTQLITSLKYSTPLHPFYLHDQRWKCVSCPAGFSDQSMMSPQSFSLLVEFMLPNKTWTVKEANVSPLMPLYWNAAGPEAAPQHSLNICLLGWKSVLALLTAIWLGAATRTCSSSVFKTQCTPLWVLLLTK